MEETWIADRSTLRHLLGLHPTWTHPQFADCLHRSLSWVKKWRKRFAQADPTDQTVVFGLSRARHTPSPAMDQRVERAILDLRDQPPENLGRVPGPKAILSYLPRRAEFVEQNVRLPRSTRTIWKVLRRHDRLLQAPQRKKRPVERRDPRGARSRSISRMPRRSRRIPMAKASANTWSRFLTVWTPGPQSCWAPTSTRTPMPRPSWRPSCSSCVSTGCLPLSRWTVILALWAARVRMTSPPPFAAFCFVWGLHPLSARLSAPTATI
jgi:hypothetical protein